MMADITIFLDFVDQDTGTSFGYQLFHTFDLDVKYSSKYPYIPFAKFTESQINKIVEKLIAEENVNSVPLYEWIRFRFEEMYAEPKPKSFTFQIQKNEPVGVGISPVM
jgi:hypothetical protein